MAAAALVWFRDDLRTADNAALRAALATGVPVHAVHVAAIDPTLRPPGAAWRWWQHRALNLLAADLARLGICLHTLSGPTRETLVAFAGEHAFSAVFWNRRYAPAEREIDTAVKDELRHRGLRAESYPGNVLVEPFDIQTGGGTPYAVFTPFWRALRTREIAPPVAAPPAVASPLEPAAVDAAYQPPLWSLKLTPHWTVGEAAARQRLSDFLDTQLAGYAEGRDFPAREVTSLLSPHLAHGEISARQIWHAAQAHAHRHPELSAAVDKFLSELAWRDFSIHQLYHRADIAAVAMQPRFDALDWRQSEADLQAWQQGGTGIPIIDAGMRELWATGYMHNRARMLTASFLAKNLLLDWRLGERWFWDCLVDADLASNSFNWQWVAGTGLDAAPYFRIFNPLTQAERFDPSGDYVRRWVPELGAANYPAPIVDLKASRARALAAFGAL